MKMLGIAACTGPAVSSFSRTCPGGLTPQPNPRPVPRIHGARPPAGHQGPFAVAISLTNPRSCVPDMFMIIAPSDAAPPDHPAAMRGPVADGATVQPRGGRVLSLLRKLIAYGQDLARTVQGRASAGMLVTIAVQFGTRDMALILARVARGLRLAAALETRLISRPGRQDGAAVPVRSSPPQAPADRPRRACRSAGTRPPLPDVP